MRYVGKKIGMMLFTILLITFLVFFAFTIIPGDAASARLGLEATQEEIDALRAQMGYDKPVPVRYWNWLTAFVQGDFGTSYKYNVSVKELIAPKIPVTIWMAVLSFLMIIVVSLPIGIYTAKKNGTIIDRMITVLNQIIMAVPHFFMGIILTFVFGLILHLFTPGNYISYKTDLGGFLRYLFFPCVAIALPKIAMSIRMIKSSCLSEAKKDYTRTAYSKGNNTKQVLYKHVLKNAMFPVITLWGMTFADLLVGSIVIEQVFNIPGVGRTLLSSISFRDFQTVQAIIVIVAFVVVVSNFIVDMLYQILDPRVDVQE